MIGFMLIILFYHVLLLPPDFSNNSSRSFRTIFKLRVVRISGSCLFPVDTDLHLFFAMCGLLLEYTVMSFFDDYAIHTKVDITS